MESNTTVIAMNLFDGTLGVIAADGRGTIQPYGEIIGDRYRKVLRLHGHVYMGCSGDSDLIEALDSGFPYMMAESTPSNMKEITDMVLDAVNLYADISLKDKERPCSLKGFVVGTIGGDPICIYEICTLGDGSVVHYKKKLHEAANVAGTGSRGAQAYFDKLLNEGPPIIKDDDDCVFDHVLEGMRFAIQRDPLSGCRIIIILIRHGGVTRKDYEPVDPDMSNSEYSWTMVIDHLEVEVDGDDMDIEEEDTGSGGDRSFGGGGGWG